VSAGLDSADVGRGEKLPREWIYAISVILAGVAVLGLLFREEVLGAYRVWTGSATYNHCFLILPIALFMIWRRRQLLASVVPHPDLRFVVLIVPLSLAWMVAASFSILEGQQLVLMTMLQVMFLAVLGPSAYIKLLAPLLYLYFLVPSGEFLVPALQDFTARFAVRGLELIGIPVFSDGIIIEVPAGTFIVAEACAGLRFLIAAVAFGVFYAVEMYESRTRRLIFIGLSVVVPILANGLRAFGLIAAAEAFGSAAAVEADHITYGWVFFSVVLVALIGIGKSFSDRHEETEDDTTGGPPPRCPTGFWAFVLPATLSVGLAGLASAAGGVLLQLT
jgi:exosortase A